MISVAWADTNKVSKDKTRTCCNCQEKAWHNTMTVFYQYCVIAEYKRIMHKFYFCRDCYIATS